MLGSPQVTKAFLPLPDGEVLGCHAGGSTGLDSAVFRLVGAVYEARPGEAHRCLRQRILTSSEPSEADRALVRVAAGKIGMMDERLEVEMVTWLDAVADGIPAIYNERSVLHGLESKSPLLLAEELDALVRSLPRDENLKRAEQDRPLAAALLDPQGRLVLAARNTAGRNKTRHAEVNLLSIAQAAGLLPLAAGWRVVTTLSPCKMCAALLVSAFADPKSARVLYLNLDPGKLARDTALDRLGACGPLG